MQTGREGDKRRDQHLGERQEIKREEKEEQPGEEEREEREWKTHAACGKLAVVIGTFTVCLLISRQQDRHGQ